MPQGTLTVQHDGTLTVVQRLTGDTAALEAAVAAFAELVSVTDTQACYRLTAASIWQARRAGLSLEAILQTLETHSTTDLPPNVRADIARWSRQIDRLTLEADQGRLLLRSANPLAITAVMRHRTLGAFVTRQFDATTVELRADAYPALVQTFDACRAPILDRVPTAWHPGVASPSPVSRQPRSGAQTSPRPVQAGGRRAEVIQVLRRLPQQCQAITNAGRQCKNRARPASRFCRVHADRSPQPVSLETYTPQERLASELFMRMLETGLVTLPQLAVVRMVVLMGIGLGTWLLSLLLRGIGVGERFLALPPWGVAGLALVLTCGLVGYLAARMRLLASLHLLLLMVTSVVLDCLHKEGLILNICFVIIPVVGPAVVLSRYGLSLGWVFLCFPFGVGLGMLFYAILNSSVTLER